MTRGNMKVPILYVTARSDQAIRDILSMLRITPATAGEKINDEAAVGPSRVNVHALFDLHAEDVDLVVVYNSGPMPSAEMSLHVALLLAAGRGLEQILIRDMSETPSSIRIDCDFAPSTIEALRVVGNRFPKGPSHYSWSLGRTSRGPKKIVPTRARQL